MKENDKTLANCDESVLESCSLFFNKMKEVCAIDKNQCNELIEKLEACYCCSVC